ncbi:hypothetical protein GYMLUDRAFT_50538 [Collybiopsis luxurians FD-317 M1]|uniref:Acetyl-CoA synthetase-like protein n=1 Tax=Collybiopsis luxurians FD-317 M1 TaxID=944289 RepID=A0A0D0BAX6_9AGAR|nr:hypothetical protein GYMLUDRAFT_50538 [Collybiopsis luxurians FD-317 M1]
MQSEPLTQLPPQPNLIPHLIDFRVKHDAHRICMSYSLPGTPRYVNITFGDFGAAVDNAAWTFDSQIGARRKSSEPTKVVGILARSDAAYMVTIYALHKCGIVPLLISPRNSRVAIVNLLKLTKSVALISDSVNKSEAEASAAEAGSLPVFDMAPLPSPGAIKSKPFPFNLEWKTECDKPVIYLHTSGSTGLPKPVAWNSRFVMHQGFYPPNFVAKYTGCSALATLPLFHGSGVALTRASFIWLGWRVIFPDPSKPVTATALVDLCTSPSPPDIIIGAPSVIEEISHIEGGLDIMRSRRFWFFVGAPVPPHFGDLLVQEKIHFLSMLGSTEIGQMNVLEPEGRESKDWQYHQLRPDLDIVLEPRGSQPGGGPFELVILANEDGWKPGTINVNINGTEGYSTSDLYEKHPSDARLFKHCGRADDVVVLSNGEKTLSRPIESCIEAHPHVFTAIVFGTGRTQNGVLVVPVPSLAFDPNDDEKLANFRNGIWDAVERANQSSPSHSQIWKEMILVATPGKDLPRTDKGSVRRKEAIQLYAKEIDEIYLRVELFSSDKGVPLPAELDTEGLIPFFANLVGEAMGRLVSADEDVFALGMDSLKAIYVRNSLLSALRRDGRMGKIVLGVPQNFVFMYTSVRAMAGAIATLAKTGRILEEDHVQAINAMVDKYTKSFPSRPSVVVPRKDVGGEVVILTGSTGSLGSFILDILLKDNKVSKVLCFNRPGEVSSECRQHRSFTERKLDSTLLTQALTSGKLEFHEINLSLPFFGLDENVYKDIHLSATLIIHNAWTLNFNWQLATFEDIHIAGLRNIVDFALTSPSTIPPRIAFTSSIASVGAYPSTTPVPELPLSDPTHCLAQGYAASKFVGERILALAAERTGLSVLAFRIGQISGDTREGMWNVTDHVPVLLRGCQEMGVVPGDWPVVVNWTPVDEVARVVVDIALVGMGMEGETGTFHIANPRPTKWADLVPVVQRTLVSTSGSGGGGGDAPLPVISMQEWLDRLKDSSQSPDDNPAVKLVAFWENNLAGKGIRCSLAVDKTKGLSSTLRNVSVVDEDMLRFFIGYWQRVGFLKGLDSGSQKV